MTDIDTLIARVRELDAGGTAGPWKLSGGYIDYREAAPLLAAEVERLRAQVEEMRAALEPFANFDVTARTGAGLRKSDWDRARLALAGAK